MWNLSFTVCVACSTSLTTYSIYSSSSNFILKINLFYSFKPGHWDSLTSFHWVSPTTRETSRQRLLISAERKDREEKESRWKADQWNTETTFLLLGERKTQSGMTTHLSLLRTSSASLYLYSLLSQVCMCVYIKCRLAGSCTLIKTVAK